MYAATGATPSFWTSMADDLGQLQGYVHSGQLHMTEEAAQELKQGVMRFQDILEEVIRASDYISQEPQIGSSPVCDAVKPFLASIATDQNQGLLPQVQQMREKTKDIVDNIDQCVRSLEGTDHSGAQGLKGQMDN